MSGITLMVIALAPALSWHGHAPPAHSTDPAPRLGAQADVPGGPVTGTARSRFHSQPAVGNPRQIRIPAIGLVADVVPLSIQPNGSLSVPEDFSHTGWYADGPEPGDPGPAVVVGHLDSRVGPAVFSRLPELMPGHHIVIETRNGIGLTFVVERTEQYPKEHFPTTEVYGPTHERVLRLVTCDGAFDRAASSYRDNLVVFARLAGINGSP